MLPELQGVSGYDAFENGFFLAVIPCHDLDFVTGEEELSGTHRPVCKGYIAIRNEEGCAGNTVSLVPHGYGDDGYLSGHRLVLHFYGECYQACFLFYRQ